MDETLPDHKAITVPVPTVNLATEDRFKASPVADICHVAVQLSDRRMDAIIQSIAGVPYDFNEPWPFWVFIGKIVSKAFFGNEEQLEWLNAVRVRTREFIAFINIQNKRDFDPNEWNIKRTRPQIVEVDFFKPQPGEELKLFWKPAREIIYQKVQGCEWVIVSLDFDMILSTFAGLSF